MSGMSQKQKDNLEKLTDRVGRLESNLSKLWDNFLILSSKMDDIVEANMKTIEALEGKRVVRDIPPVEDANAVGIHPKAN
jgi:uncharacterized FlaG/YvyC family protein